MGISLFWDRMLTHMIVVCALFYELKNHLECKESYWFSVKAINENIGSDSEAYRNLNIYTLSLLG